MTKKIGNDVSPATSGQNTIIDEKIDVIDGFHDVPAQNSSSNTVLRDVIGNKTDNVVVPYSCGVSSVMSFLHTGYYHVHGASFLYPDKANPITLTSPAGEWGQGTDSDIIEILPASEITKDFDIHWCSLSSISAALYGVIDLYEYVDSAWVKIGPLTDVVRTSAFSREGDARVQVKQIAANTRLGAKFTDSTATAKTVELKIKGHVYSTSLT